MSYQVLARKWRPRNFSDIVGQEHVVRALTNALERDQLHHAYLLTGTRGVGKTTLARILAKAINCERGVGAHPCGECTTCREVDEARMVDLLEVDAASRTKVEQTRELLDNVPFAPARARFKVYLIDEVHMFSTHSFNALLKTLEEPPPHVKFLLATTDPQKIPVTVLSRCLQLNLRRLLPEEIRDRLSQVLQAEGVEFEPAALAVLARAADGSLRDALSLLDQAIAFGGGRLTDADVRTMLGAVSGALAFDLLDALAAGAGATLLGAVERVAALTPDFDDLLRELLVQLHRVALQQQVPDLIAPDDPDRERLAALCDLMPPEDVQLFYQVLLTGQQDLAVAPDPRTGFEMVLLRALAFRPAQTAAPQQNRSVAPGQTPVPSTNAPQPRAELAAATDVRPPPRRSDDSVTDALPTSAPAPVSAATLSSDRDWQHLVGRLPLGGIAAQLARNCGFVAWSDGVLHLALDPSAEQLNTSASAARLGAALAQALGEALRLEIKVVGSSREMPTGETPAQRHVREASERQQAAVEALAADPVARQLQTVFDADWLPDSIRPED